MPAPHPALRPGPRAALAAAALPLLLALGACKPAEDCGMTSALDSFEPLCSGELIQYVGETRVFIYGTGGTLTAFLPEEVAVGVYGGTSGNPLTVILDQTGGEALRADDRLRTLTVARIAAGEAELRIIADFDGQAIKGPLVVPVTSAEEDGV